MMRYHLTEMLSCRGMDSIRICNIGVLLNNKNSFLVELIYCSIPRVYLKCAFVNYDCVCKYLL